MSVYGQYETIKEFAWSNGATLYTARKDGAENFIVKVYPLAFFGFAGDDQQKAEEFADSFNGRIEVQQKAASQTKKVISILQSGFDNDSAWYVTQLYPNSVQQIIQKHVPLKKEDYFRLFTAILQATQEFKKICGRSHGNLKPGNVFLGSEGKGTLDQVLLSDPAPGDATHAVDCELADLRGIGEMLHRLVINEDREEEYWKLPPPPSLQEWIKIFGKEAEGWHSLCTRLLEPDLTVQNYNLDELAFDLGRLKPQPKFSSKQLAIAAGVAGVIVVSGVFVAKLLSSSHHEVARQTEQARQAEEARQKLEEQATKLAKEKRLALERAEAETKAREVAQKKAETEAKRFAEEKQAAELKAAADEKARQEAKQLAEAAEKGRLEASQKAAEEERLLKQAQEKAAEAARIAAQTPVISSTAEPKTAETTAEIKILPPVGGKEWTNSLGMKFVPTGQRRLLFCVWETRRKDFERFVKYSSYAMSNWRNTTFKQTANEPVVSVDGSDAIAFCKWLTETERQSGLLTSRQSYRLPTEAEWQTAATGGQDSSRTYAWGMTLPPPPGDENLSPWCSYDRFAFTSPVGSFQANALGLYDTLGNAWEICQTDSARNFVARGGSWQTESPAELALQYRLQLIPGDRREDVGFRCVIDLGQ